MGWKSTIFGDEIYSKLLAIFLFSFLYVLNYSDVASLVLLKKITTLIFCSYSTLLLFNKFRELSIFSRFVIITGVLVSGLLVVVYQRTSFISDVLLFLTLMQIFETKIWLTKKFINKLLWISFLGIVINLFFYYRGKVFLSGLDSNYSAFVLFLFFLFLQKLKISSRVIWFFSVIPLATMSRGVFVALILNGLSFFIKTTEKSKRWLSLFAPFLLLGMFTIWVLINKSPPQGLKQVELFISQGWNSLGEWMRFFYFINNNSDFVRHEANINYFHFLNIHPETIWAGIDLQTYENVYKLIPPHNIFLLQALQSGMLLGFLWLAYFFKQLFDRSTLHFTILIGLAPYFAFLGIEICAIYTLFLGFILQLDVRLGA